MCQMLCPLIYICACRASLVCLLVYELACFLRHLFPLTVALSPLFVGVFPAMPHVRPVLRLSRRMHMN